MVLPHRSYKWECVVCHCGGTAVDRAGITCWFCGGEDVVFSNNVPNGAQQTVMFSEGDE